jgi:hypothetical protein
MATLERCYTVSEIARHWNVSHPTARERFANQSGVFRIGKTSRLRIPESVLRSVEDRLANRTEEPYGESHCPKHPNAMLVCPACKGKEGGKATGRKYSHEQLVRWGRSGGRPKKVAS